MAGDTAVELQDMVVLGYATGPPSTGAVEPKKLVMGCTMARRPSRPYWPYMGRRMRSKPKEA
ncbi:hypothetical protein E2562_019840 [Oryza meyeriana var. granulata]|uniref:Uncharacterized protein n=1 Tax=Oryza meyeriana var. granulata TaxID=110450 RepID=A0A6G1CS51_9ORYZ|nr:hypothetical protein E2562_019840 [Oryza meyeriana var. granulata]